MQFEQSEFVSREPIASESEKEVKGKAGPLSRTSSALALPSLVGVASGAGSNGGIAGGISRAFENAAGTNGRSGKTGATSNGNGSGFTTGSRLPGIPSSHGSNHSSSSSSDESTAAQHQQPSGLLPTTPRGYYSGSGAVTPGAGGPGGGGGLFGVMSPHNPVWKHEVSL